MKSFITIIAIALMSIFTINVANATVRTVSNNLNTPGQYNTVTAAYNASATNDTVYLTPSPITYGDLSVTGGHAVTVIGGGYNNPATQDNYTSIIGNLILNSNSSNSTISGLQISNVVMSYTGSQSNNVTISLCNVTGIFCITGGNTIIQNCIIADLRFGYVAANNVYVFLNLMSNIAIRNNFIIGPISGIPLLSNNYFYHNIIEGHVNSLSNCTFNDNIFFYSDLANSTFESNCVFNNNGVFSGNASAELNYMSANGNISTNNVSSSISPIFNNSASSAQNFAGLLNYDWTIVSGAPENKIGRASCRERV